MNLMHFHPYMSFTERFTTLELQVVSLGISLDVGLGLHCQGFLP